MGGLRKEKEADVKRTDTQGTRKGSKGLRLGSFLLESMPCPLKKGGEIIRECTNEAKAEGRVGTKERLVKLGKTCSAR